MTRPTVLLSRPAADADETAEIYRDLMGDAVHILAAPILAIRPLPVPEIDAGWGIVLTSRHAVSAGIAGRQVWCVGDRTAAVARASGATVEAVAEDGEALLATLLQDPPSLPLLHLRGEHVAIGIAGRLRSHGLTADERIVYRQEAVPLPRGVQEAIRTAGRVVVPVYSRRSARLLSAAWPSRAAPPLVVAISSAAAAAWQGPTAGVVVARRPDAEATAQAVAIMAGVPPATATGRGAG